MGHDSLLQSIASSGQAIISNVKSYDMKLQQVPSLLSGFMESYGSISSTFSPKPMSFNVDWNRCVANNSQATHPHCAAVQAFVIDISVIGSVAVFTLLVAFIALCWINGLIALLTHDTSEAHINEDDEVILELDMSSTDSTVAKPKRSESDRSTVPWIILLCIFMTCGLVVLGIALYAQISVISESESVWHDMAITSDNFQRTNIQTLSRLNQSLFNATDTLDVILAESKSSIESRWLDAEVVATFRNQKALRWKQLSQNVTNLTESFFASLPKSGTCLSCRNEELLAASVDFEVGTQIPNVSVASPASQFRNNSDVRWSFNMLQTAFANETVMLGKLASFINQSNLMQSKVIKSIYALWSLEVACILSYCVLTFLVIWILYAMHLEKTKKATDSGADNEELFGKLIKLSRSLKWFALLGALLSSFQWISVAFSFSIGRYFNELCAGMDRSSPAFRDIQSYIFDPSTAHYLASCASTSNVNKDDVMFDAPLSAIISQLASYNVSSKYNFTRVLNQIDVRLMQSQRASVATSSLTLATALDSYSNYGKQIASVLSLVNQLSSVNCFWGNISLCSNCKKCTSLQEESDFQSKHADLISVEQSIVSINDAVQLDVMGWLDFVRAARSDQEALKRFQMAVVTQVQKSSDSVRSVSAYLRNQWECLGVNNALSFHSNFQALMCDINSMSAASIIHVSWVTFAIGALVFQWISMLFLYIAGQLLLSASHFGSLTGKYGSKKIASVLNDVSLSAAEHTHPELHSISTAAGANGPSVSPSKRFIPLSAPAKGSVTSSP